MLLLSHKSRPPRQGVILLAVLVVIVMMALAAYAYNDLIVSEYRAADTYSRTNQARAAADSGIAYTMGMLCDPNAYINILDYNTWNNPSVFQDVVVNNDPNSRLRTKFSIISLCSDPNDPFYTDANTPYRFGVQDESAKLNLNSLLSVTTNDTTRQNILTSMGVAVLATTPNSNNILTSDLACYILDWMDPNPVSSRTPTAKDTVYQGMQPPYHVKCGPFDTLEELLLVYTVTPQMVFGNDRNRNGQVLPADEDGYQANQGWSNYMTVYSREPNIDVNNNPRIFVNDTNLQQLNTNLAALQETNAALLAQFVIAYRLYGGTSPPAAVAPANAAGGAPVQAVTTPLPPPPPTMASADITAVQTQITTDLANATGTWSKNLIPSLTSLMTSTISVPVKDSTGRMRNVTYYSPMAYQANQSVLLPILFDELTFTNAADLLPRINVNMASQLVLQMLPNLSQQEWMNIQTNQPINPDMDPTDPTYNTIGWLIIKANIAPAKVQAIEPYITARSRVYRFQSIGYCDSGTPVCRLEVVVDTSYGRPRIVYRRDISELGSGNFDFLPKPSKK